MGAETKSIGVKGQQEGKGGEKGKKMLVEKDKEQITMWPKKSAHGQFTEARLRCKGSPEAVTAAISGSVLCEP